MATAQHDKRVVLVGGLRQQAAAMRGAHVYLGAYFLECDPDLAEQGTVEILDNKNPHDTPDMKRGRRAVS
ncbi:hypothetical protein GCM10007937_60220 [Mesorhizobium albiziae]|nr:hypothetical protein GCM10007937_60220 [Mesorhizobium albiziae]